MARALSADHGVSDIPEQLIAKGSGGGRITGAATITVTKNEILYSLNKPEEFILAIVEFRADGAHPYNVPPEHTERARQVLGAGKLLAPEVAVTLERDPAKARELGRAHLAIYFGLPNYTNSLRALGFTDDDFADGGSNRLIDALVAWGSVDRVATVVRAHHDAGADHVCIQVVVPRGGNESPAASWRELAPALVG